MPALQFARWPGYVLEKPGTKPMVKRIYSPKPPPRTAEEPEVIPRVPGMGKHLHRREGDGEKTHEIAFLHQQIVEMWLGTGCLSKTEAMINCGYSRLEAKRSASLIFARPEVAKYVRKRQEQLVNIKKITKERIEAEFAQIAFTNEGDMIEVDPQTGEPEVDWRALTPEMRLKLSNFETDVTTTWDREGGTTIKRKIRTKFHDKVRALEALARIQGMFKDEVKIDGSDIVAQLQAGRMQARIIDVEEPLEDLVSRDTATAREVTPYVEAEVMDGDE